jgi:hypothetical protein
LLAALVRLRARLALSWQSVPWARLRSRKIVSRLRLRARQAMARVVATAGQVVPRLRLRSGEPVARIVATARQIVPWLRLLARQVVPRTRAAEAAAQVRPGPAVAGDKHLRHAVRTLTLRRMLTTLAALTRQRLIGTIGRVILINGEAFD